MRTFIFKILFRLTWWVAPNRPRVNRIFDLYLEEIKKEEKLGECQRRAAHMERSTRPRTYPTSKDGCKSIRHTDYYERD